MQTLGQSSNSTIFEFELVFKTQYQLNKLIFNEIFVISFVFLHQEVIFILNRSSQFLLEKLFLVLKLLCLQLIQSNLQKLLILLRDRVLFNYLLAFYFFLKIPLRSKIILIFFYPSQIFVKNFLPINFWVLKLSI